MRFNSIETEISFNLLVWGLSSIVGGVTFMFFQNTFMNALGFQFIIWGTVDSGIAVGSIIYRSIKKLNHEENLTKLKKILLMKILLDISFIFLGIIIFIGIIKINEYNGHGLGVIIQGGFLALFDTYYVVKIMTKGSRWERKKY